MKNKCSFLLNRIQELEDTMHDRTEDGILLSRAKILREEYCRQLVLAEIQEIEDLESESGDKYY